MVSNTNSKFHDVTAIHVYGAAIEEEYVSVRIRHISGNLTQNLKMTAYLVSGTRPVISPRVCRRCCTDARSRRQSSPSNRLLEVSVFEVRRQPPPAEFACGRGSRLRLKLKVNRVTCLPSPTVNTRGQCVGFATCMAHEYIKAEVRIRILPQVCWLFTV